MHHQWPDTCTVCTGDQGRISCWGKLFCREKLTLSQLSLDHLPAYRILLQLQCVVSNIFSMSARSSKVGALVIIGGHKHKGPGHEAMAQQETTDNTIDDGFDKNALKDRKQKTSS